MTHREYLKGHLQTLNSICFPDGSGIFPQAGQNKRVVRRYGTLGLPVGLVVPVQMNATECEYAMRHHLVGARELYDVPGKHILARRLQAESMACVLREEVVKWRRRRRPLEGLTHGRRGTERSRKHNTAIRWHYRARWQTCSVSGEVGSISCGGTAGTQF